MAKNQPNKTPWRNTSSSLSLDREDIIIISTSLAGILLFVTVCLFTPIARFVSPPVNTLSGSAETSSRETASSGSGWGGGGILGTGIYSVGKMLMSLGQRDEYVESDIDIEYDGQRLTVFSNGEVRDESGANHYFKGREGKIRDALVKGAAGFSASQVKKPSGYDQFKDHLVEAMNENLSNQDLITNVYFRKFVLFPGENQRDG